MKELQIRQMQISRAKDEIRCCNELNQIYGLTLTEADITELVGLRGQALKSTGRVEFGGGIVPKLIRAFCKSSYVDPYNYAASLDGVGYISLRRSILLFLVYIYLFRYQVSYNIQATIF